ncbi:fimbrial protein [Ewingella americana]|uniref:Fimbrial protein n=1 Tax=Ewingella americana TaxID=41202 RepID=A0A502GAH1_9GAMM|nr:fimbrial protein [Ewingella americana]TPG58794.1 fimbrial protein [Ewingella americana]
MNNQNSRVVAVMYSAHRKPLIYTLLCGALLCFSPYTFADYAACEPVSSPGSYDNNRHDDLQTSQNIIGYNYASAFNASPETYQITCSCSATDALSSGGVVVMYSVKTPLPSGGVTNQYKINDHLNVSMKVDLPDSGGEMQVPIAATSDRQHHRAKDGTGVCEQQEPKANINAGSQGTITLYITRPFIGQIEIPPTVIAEVYASSGNNATSLPPLGSPVAKIILSGTLTVPQSCEINKGETISVDFGYIPVGKFTTRSQPPEGFRPSSFDIIYDCTQNGIPTIPVGTRLAMTLEGNDVKDQYDLIARRRPSDNVPDIGIKVYNASGTAIPFIAGDLPMDQLGSGRISLKAYVINLVGGPLDTGEFDATATLKIDIR